ncbi:MAG: peptidylprolyl isomerase [Alloprevotella sp.]|uniref:peptidylprolyl isomerase n=1 Tax=Prevotellamassilia timonensis TaxID=1852370 RepID=UPI001D3B65C3|nr:peptidylprolyl isomerase [Prevotellamassilia timonensis]MBS7395204.1 peptidylprolyl isomerase [Prevotellamassilia sp.]MCI5507543.1 peptidylprolyl isomerase [Bacteroidales bacterium]MDY2974622.1 peptidylprolyl isomerase [Alloprevotella sp.]MCF2634858.1 peptidylprolyl isomerase [Prevotellamassilia timonensis]MCI6068849.1 peptidylprolyl isomerase [Bacteroidales bacterium]
MKRLLLYIYMVCLPLLAAAQKNVVDEVIWVVGDEPILLSDVEEARISAELSGQPVTNPYCTIPEQLAVRKLFLHQAAIDSVTVSEGDIIRGVDARINEYISVYGSREAVEQAAQKSIRQLRETFKRMYREENMVEEVKSNLTSKISATPAEVREFFKNTPTDSLPFIPTQVEVQIITSQPKVSRQEVERVEARLRDFAQSVNSGESDFSTLAKLYSEDGSARMGGELGYTGRNMWVPEFANVAFSLNDPKKVSKIVRTEFGFHIIQLIDKRGDKVNVRHILLKPQIEEAEFERGIARLDSIADDIRAERFTFDAAAYALSDDKDTRNNHGLMANVIQETRTISSRFQMKDLPQDVAKVVDTLQVGQVSRAFRMTNQKGQTVCAIVRLKSRIDGHHANMTEDFQVLRDQVIAKRREEKINNWIKEKVNSTYVRISPDWRNCDFKYEGWVKTN